MSVAVAMSFNTAAAGFTLAVWFKTADSVLFFGYWFHHAVLFNAVAVVQLLLQFGVHTAGANDVFSI